MNLLPSAEPLQAGDAYLKLQLDRQTSAILPIKSVQKVLVASVQSITPIANMSTPVIGWLNQGSRVFWVVDLPQLIGLHSLEDVKSFSVAVVKAEFPLGLAVRKVTGVTRLDSGSIMPAKRKVAANLLPYLQGCVLQHKEVLPILDPQAIVHSPVLHD